MEKRGKEQAGKGLSVYAHVPFCKSKCPYCDFNSVKSGNVPEKDYARALIEELGFVLENEDLRFSPFTKGSQRGFGNQEGPLKTLYIGGGTPSLIEAKTVGAILEGIFNALPPVKDVEITLEANPDTTSLEKLRGLKKTGVNRISIGVQSFDDKDLRSLGRTHDAAKSILAVINAEKAGFKNICIDLIFGIPGQSLSAWEVSLKKTIELRAKHVSIYCLKIEEGTPFYDMQKKGEIKTLSEDLEIEMYLTAMEMLKHAGYVHYEISNFSLPGFESRHNCNYWKGGGYIGLGAGAHSYSKHPGFGKRWWNEKDPYKYMELACKGKGVATGSEILTKEQALTEGLFLGIRVIEGINEKEFEARFGVPIDTAMDVERFTSEGLLVREGAMLRLTQKGILLSNEVF
ncbi:MAG: radical SAM family heme chaperone HemW [Thermodesulfobacteriota bacterium]